MSLRPDEITTGSSLTDTNDSLFDENCVIHDPINANGMTDTDQNFEATFDANCVCEHCIMRWFWAGVIQFGFTIIRMQWFIFSAIRRLLYFAAEKSAGLFF